MIYTLTLNPALDKMVTFNEISRKDVNRPLKIEFNAGGKGINVSRALNVLGEENKALFFSGGDNGNKIEKLLETEGVICSVIKIEEETRENSKLYGVESGEEIRINEKGAAISLKNLEEMNKKLEKIEENSYIVMSGTIPAGIEESFYYDTAVNLKEKRGVKVIIDADLDSMKYAIKASPFMIKPNMEELERITGKKNDINGFINIIKENKIEYGFLTDGKNGAYLYNGGKLYLIKSPEVEAVTTLGAGDSFIGGFLHGVSKNKSLEESLKIAAATAAAKVEEKFNRDRINKLKEKVKIEEIKITEEI